MKVNITGFMRNMLRPNCREMVAEFLGHLKELRNEPAKHGEFFDLYVFGDDAEYRNSKSKESPEPAANSAYAKCAEEIMRSISGRSGIDLYQYSSDITKEITQSVVDIISAHFA